ncbi:unnamed protein product [Sphenostylis stenocarpa]|uniref:Uncharacterized protein n=1 Tax=Sphenostylis stenocarpa TaxID=92480 RepID=A0AA86VXA8_9FABA|nr:unnamed protein product [Sphenostylis stenocarpa]
MSGFVCLKLSPPPPPPLTLSKPHLPLRNTLLGAALSFGLLFSFPSVSALQLPAQPCSHLQPPQETLQIAPEVVTNQGLVEEAWQIVNDTFLDTGRHRWSQDTWQLKREAVLSNSIQTRSKAHQIIKRMLSSLGDPYTRFLSPDELKFNSFESQTTFELVWLIVGPRSHDEPNKTTRMDVDTIFSKMARYDMTGVGINLKEVPSENGDLRLEVLGIILDGPAHSAGVRQVDKVDEHSSKFADPQPRLVHLGKFGANAYKKVRISASRTKQKTVHLGKAGGDEILAVNNTDVKGKSAFEVSSLLQGPNGTSVTIQVKHGNCGPVESIEVQRQLVARTPVFYRLEQLDSGVTPVGYIRLKEFNALARKDLVIAMKRLQDMGASYFILDLRDNLGGLVQAGIEIAKLFLNEGDTQSKALDYSWRDSTVVKDFLDTSIALASYSDLVIYTVGRDPQLQKAIVSDTSPLIQAPVVVLVNDKTASASEIVASALHDNCRAVLVGKRTYGKGLIQSVFELDDGSGVVITVGKYVTPNHKDINGNGIEPDFQKLPAWDDISQHLKKCSMTQQG